MPPVNQSFEQTSIPNTEIDATTHAQIFEHNAYLDRSVGDILFDISRITDNNEKGKAFETLTQHALPLIKSMEISKVKKPSGDIGTDLIGIHTTGYKIAIQCKFLLYANVTRNDIVRFIDSADARNITAQWLVCHGHSIAKNAQGLIQRNDIKIIDLRAFGDTKITTDLAPVRQPLPLQQEAIDAVIQGFNQSGNDRGRLIMACGTGKTFTALRIAETLVPNKANLLFIAPSIALVAQARNEWLNHSQRPLTSLVICSDSTAGHSEDIKTNELACRVTTDPQEIANSLAKKIARDEGHATFCTYQSLDKLSTAQAEYGAPAFDLAVIDEAHRTTGRIDGDNANLFQMIHDTAKINSDNRLYMTATPRIYKESKSTKHTDAIVVDMNDADTYGNQFYHLTFKKAVNAGMLCDYRVIALGVSEDMIGVDLRTSLLKLNSETGAGKAADDQSVLALGAISLAINGFISGANTPGVIERTIAYASNIRRSQWLARALGDSQMKRWVTRTGRNADAGDNRALTIKAMHLDGKSSALERHSALHELNEDSNSQIPRLITNAKLFTEGVDVPALNAVAFLDPRNSKIDTMQAVGRVMRSDKQSGKVFGYIIVPVILPPGADILATLEADKSRFQSLGNVLRALQSHDERLYTELSTHLEIAEVEPSDEQPPREDYNPIQQTLLDDDVKQAIFAQIANYTGIAKPGKVIADAITQAIERVARILENEGVAKIIAKTIGTPVNSDKESCKIAALLIANACIMHKRLEETGNLSGLTQIEAANNTKSPASALCAAWTTILRKDYSPIFQDATALLHKLPENKRIQAAIHILMECAIQNATTLNELGFDHAGPLYHRVLGTAQSDGAYYTKNLSAYLLAGLAFDENFTDWKDPQKVRELRIADPACGTGTLLMAALNTIKRRAAAAQNLTAEQTELLHKHLVEKTIYGFDINKYSIQLAACNLTIGAPNTDYSGMNLHTLQHGPVVGTDGNTPNEVRHGALEMLLGMKDMRVLQQTIAEIPAIYGTNAERRKTKLRAPENLDAVIYNPPFTDTQREGQKFSDTVQEAMTQRLGFIKNELVSAEPETDQVIGQRSIQPYFTPLVSSMLQSTKGTLAKIIPATVCTSENSRAQRQYIAAHHQIEMVITSHDPKHVNFSENTSIHECLLIARRSIDNSKPTRFIQLVEYPADVKQAEVLIDAIQSGKPGGLYSETLWPANKVQRGDWSPLQWFNPKLVEATNQINDSKNLIQSGDIHAWNPDGVSFRLAFDRERSDDGDSFCTTAEGTMQTIQAQPETKATPKKGKETTAKKLQQKADHVLVATRFRTTNNRVTAIYSDQPTLGSAFRPIGVGDKQTAKAFAAFMNSSFGIIQMLNRRTKTLDYPAYSSGQMRSLHLPDPNADLSPLLDAFEKVKHTPLQRLSECHQDAARRILDHAAAKVTGINPTTTDQWRDWLSQEPTITNKQWEPMKL